MPNKHTLRYKSLGVFHNIDVDIVYHSAHGVPTDSLCFYLPEKRPVLSTRQGYMLTRLVCNAYVPRPLWDFMHNESAKGNDTYTELMKEVLEEYGTSLFDISFLSTGVNQEKVAWAEEVYDEFWVLAFATAGVKTNAIRVGIDKASGIERDGKFEKIGTINNIVFTNAILEPPALASSFITITEAKNVALQGLDIRSALDPSLLATGTGTDQIIVVSGMDYKYTYVGGHTKLGEMIAMAVTESTMLAIKNSRGF